MARVLALANPASDSGKTSATIGIASMLVDLGQQVLVVDLDPQAALTRSLGVDAESLDCSVFDVLALGAPVTAAMVDTDAGVDLLPSAIELSSIEASLVTRPGREQLLRNALMPVREDYDWIVVDCASSLGLLTLNALALADLLVVPVRGHSPRAVAQLTAMADEIRRLVNPGMALAGALALGAGQPADAELALLATIPAPPLALNAYREFAKSLTRG